MPSSARRRSDTPCPGEPLPAGFHAASPSASPWRPRPASRSRSRRPPSSSRSRAAGRTRPSSSAIAATASSAPSSNGPAASRAGPRPIPFPGPHGRRWRPRPERRARVHRPSVGGARRNPAGRRARHHPHRPPATPGREAGRRRRGALDQHADRARLARGVRDGQERRPAALGRAPVERAAEPAAGEHPHPALARGILRRDPADRGHRRGAVDLPRRFADHARAPAPSSSTAASTSSPTRRSRALPRCSSRTIRFPRSPRSETRSSRRSGDRVGTWGRRRRS